MFEIREASHAKRRFFLNTVANPSATGPWKPTQGVHPANAPRNVAQKISRGVARSDLASRQSVFSFS